METTTITDSLARLRIKLGLQQEEKETKTPTFHSRRFLEERELFLAYCKFRILTGSIDSYVQTEFLDWLCESWHTSNGYCEEHITPFLLDHLIQKHGTKSTVLLNRILHTIRFLEITAPKDIQEELIQWIQNGYKTPTIEL